MRIVRAEVDGRVIWGQIKGDLVEVTAGMLGEPTGEAWPLEEVRLLAPAEPSKIVCVGRNYLDHIREWQ